MNKILVLLLGMGIISIIVFAALSKKSNIKPPTTSQLQNSQATITQESVDYTASFAIFTNGIFRVFTATMYHNLSKDVFIKTDNPNIVHVKKNGVTWDDFFKTLPMKLTKDCLTTGTKQIFCTNNNEKLRFYLNGKEDVNALDKQILNGDRLLVTYGNENEEEIQKQLQQIP